MVTETVIADRIAEMRGRSQEIVKVEISTWIFDDTASVFMAIEDKNNFHDREFVFVVPADVSSYNSMMARGWWAETVHFEIEE